jgi:hypothetical protein
LAFVLLGERPVRALGKQGLGGGIQVLGLGQVLGRALVEEDLASCDRAYARGLLLEDTIQPVVFVPRLSRKPRTTRRLPDRGGKQVREAVVEVAAVLGGVGRVDRGELPTSSW